MSWVIFLSKGVFAINKASEIKNGEQKKNGNAAINQSIKYITSCSK